VGNVMIVQRKRPAGDGHSRLNRHSAEMPAPATTKTRPNRARLLVATVAVVGAIGVAGFLLWRLREPGQPQPAQYTPLTSFSDGAVQPSLSFDGRMLTFIRGDNPFFSPGQIYVKLLLSTRLADGRLDALLTAQRRVYLQRLKDLAELEQAARRDGRDDLVLLFKGAILHTEADLKWTDACADEIRNSNRKGVEET